MVAGVLRAVLMRSAKQGASKTGDAATVMRVRDTQQPQVSDYFVGVVSKRPTVNPVNLDGKLKYVMLLGLEPDHFLPMLHNQKLHSEWVTGLFDRNNVLITCSRRHQQFSGHATSCCLRRAPTLSSLRAAIWKAATRYVLSQSRGSLVGLL